MEIANSLQWSKVEIELWAQANKIKPQFLRDFRQVMSNIARMNTELSKRELEARRSHSGSLRRVNEQLEKINAEIYNVEQWLFMLLLS
jgi:hypothetical protein